jgi:hypothetical protein
MLFTRHTSTRWGRNCFKASIAFSARYSWKKLNKALQRHHNQGPTEHTHAFLGIDPVSEKQMIADTTRRMAKKLRTAAPAHAAASSGRPPQNGLGRHAPAASLAAKPFGIGAGTRRPVPADLTDMAWLSVHNFR